MSKLIAKYQTGTNRGGLVQHSSSGSWGNRGKGNELESILENGLSWLYDKVTNAGEYIDRGIDKTVNAFPGRDKDFLENRKRERAAGNGGYWRDTKGKTHKASNYGEAPIVSPTKSTIQTMNKVSRNYTLGKKLSKMPTTSSVVPEIKKQNRIKVRNIEINSHNSKVDPSAVRFKTTADYAASNVPEMIKAIKGGLYGSEKVLSNPKIQNAINHNAAVAKRLSPKKSTLSDKGTIIYMDKEMTPAQAHLYARTESNLRPEGHIITETLEPGIVGQERRIRPTTVDGKFAYGSTIALDPRQVTLPELTNSAFHEGLHSGYYGAPLGGDAARSNLLKLKKSKLFNTNNTVYEDYLSNTGEAATNMIEIGQAMGIKAGQSYPGYNEFKPLFDKYNQSNIFYKKNVLETIKSPTNKRDYKRIWDALNGTYLAGTMGGVYLINKEK